MMARADNNEPDKYARYVAQRAMVSPGDKVGDLDPFELLRVIEAMIKFEGWAA
jgi:hypothetical protein